MKYWETWEAYHVHQNDVRIDPGDGEILDIHETVGDFTLHGNSEGGVFYLEGKDGLVGIFAQTTLGEMHKIIEFTRRRGKFLDFAYLRQGGRSQSKEALREYQIFDAASGEWIAETKEIDYAINTARLASLQDPQIPVNNLAVYRAQDVIIKKSIGHPTIPNGKFVRMPKLGAEPVALWKDKCKRQDVFEKKYYLFSGRDELVLCGASDRADHLRMKARKLMEKCDDGKWHLPDIYLAEDVEKVVSQGRSTTADGTIILMPKQGATPAWTWRSSRWEKLKD